MVRPPWPNSTNRSSWLRPSAFHQYQVWPPQPQEQLNPFSQYNHVDVGHYVNPNIVQPTTQSQRVTAMKLEISPELPIQPSIQGNKLFVAVPAEARTIGEFKEHVAAILNVSSSVFHFTTGEFRIPDEEVIGILSCVSDQRINVVRSVRNWQTPGTPSRSRFPPIPAQSIESIQHSAANIESPPSRISRMRSPPRLTHPLPCRPPRISPKHVPSSSNDISAEDTGNLPTMPVPMSFSQMKYRINKQTSDDSITERRPSAAEGSSSSLVKRTIESHRINENGASTSSAVGHSHTHSHPIPIAVNEIETEQSQSTTPEIQVTDGSCTVYQVSAAATGDTATGKLRLLYCETINDNVNVPGTSTNGLSATVPSGFGPLAKEKNSNGMNGNSQWTGVRLQVNNETITSAFASVSTSNSPLNLSSVTKPFSTDNDRDASHAHLQMPNISAERDLSNEQRQTHSSFSHFNSLSNNNNLFSRNNRSSYVFGSTSPLIGSSFRSIPASPTNSIHNDFTRSSSSKNKQQDLFSAPSSSFIRAEPSSSVSSRTPWNIYRTFGIIEPDTSKSFCSSVLNVETAQPVTDVSSNGNLNSNLNQSSSSTTVNNHSRSPGIIQTKRRRICAIDSASIVYLHEQDDDKSVEDEHNLNPKPSANSNSASTSKHTQQMMNTLSDAHPTDKRPTTFIADENFSSFRSPPSNPIAYQHHPPSSYYKNKLRPEATVPTKPRKRNLCRRRPKLSKSTATATVTQYDTTESFPLRDPILLAVGEEPGPSTSKSNNLILEDIESEDSQNELPVKDDADVDIKILCEVGKESAFYKEDRPIIAPEDIRVGSLIVFNEKIGSKDDCDCLVLSKRKWAKVISVENSESSTSFMLWFFSPFMKRKSQTNDKKDYVRLNWDDLVDPRIVVTKSQGDSEESE